MAGRRKGSGRNIYGRNLTTGQTIMMNGSTAIADAGFTPTCVHKVCRGITKHHAGWAFAYTDESLAEQREREGRMEPIHGKSILTGERVTITSQLNAQDQGFIYISIWRCLTGKRSQHRGFVFWRDDMPEPDLKTHMIGRRVGHVRVIGTSISTGEEFVIDGYRAIAAEGFTPQTVIKCCRGELPDYSGFRWRFA